MTFSDVFCQERSADIHPHGDTVVAHSVLAELCLRAMNQQLRQNICEINDPGLFNSEVDDLPHRLETKVSDELRYACLRWIGHMTSANQVANELLDQLKLFCEQHILHWIEVLSLLGHLRLSAEMVLRAIEWSQVCTPFRTTMAG
jgi:hypothetical protein